MPLYAPTPFTAPTRPVGRTPVGPMTPEQGFQPPPSPVFNPPPPAFKPTVRGVAPTGPGNPAMGTPEGGFFGGFQPAPFWDSSPGFVTPGPQAIPTRPNPGVGTPEGGFFQPPRATSPAPAGTPEGGYFGSQPQAPAYTPESRYFNPFARPASPGGGMNPILALLSILAAQNYPGRRRRFVGGGGAY